MSSDTNPGTTMNANQIEAEIARIENARPTVGAFAASRAARLAELRAMLVAAPAAVVEPAEDAGLNRIRDCWNRNERAIRNQERRGY